ncbi:unnamed protein product [Prunus brigantina]
MVFNWVVEIFLVQGWALFVSFLLSFVLLGSFPFFCFFVLFVCHFGGMYTMIHDS